MRRLWIMIAIIGVALAAVTTAEAKPRRMERTVVGSYDLYAAPGTGCHPAGGPYACLLVNTVRSDAYFTAKVADAHGQPVFVEAYVHGDGYMRPYVSFCGKTKRPIAIPAGTWLSFDIGLSRWGAATACLTNRVKTRGTISVTLSNMD